jgi:hypothetical protein
MGYLKNVYTIHLHKIFFSKIHYKENRFLNAFLKIINISKKQKEVD